MEKKHIEKIKMVSGLFNKLQFIGQFYILELAFLLYNYNVYFKC